MKTSKCEYSQAAMDARGVGDSPSGSEAWGGVAVPSQGQVLEQAQKGAVWATLLAQVGPGMGSEQVCGGERQREWPQEADLRLGRAGKEAACIVL